MTSLVKHFKNWSSQHAVLISIAVLFFSLYLVISVPFYGILNSPDETSNYFFSKQFAQTGTWLYETPLNEEVGNVIHPRSMFVLNNALIHGSFIGLPLLYGSIASIFGSWILLLLTPLMTIIAAIFFYFLIKKLFGLSIARFSFVLFLLHPAIWYYSARSMMHNMLFIDLLLIGLSLLILRPNNRWFLIASGVSLSWAVSVRTSEVIWMAGAAVLLWLVARKKITFSSIGILIASAIIAFLPILFIYHGIYDKWCLSSYTCQQDVVQISQAVSAEESSTQTTHIVEDVEVPSFFERNLVEGNRYLSIIFPFGIVLEEVGAAIWQYGISLLWFLFVPAVSGIIFAYKKMQNKRVFWSYIGIGVFVSVFVFLYYGSWQFVDNINYWEVTLGNSFVRYFLPFYIFLIPFIAYTLRALSRSHILSSIVLVSVLLFLSMRLVMWGQSESLLMIQEVLKENADKKAIVLEQTTPETVVITERQDKVIFPDREVVYDFMENPFIAKQVNTILEHRPVSYLTYRPPRDMVYLNETYLKDFSYRVNPSPVAVGDQFLYHIELR